MIDVDLGLPLAEPGVPDTRSPGRLMVWIGRHQLGLLVTGILFGTIWMVSQSLVPFVVGRGIQTGVVDGDTEQLIVWALALLGLGVLQAITGSLRHRYAVNNWLTASFRVVQVLGRHTARTGSAISERHTTGEVVATVSNDALRMGNAFDVTARLAGAVVAYVIVAVILLTASVVLGVVVLVGVPALVLVLGVVIKPLQRRQREQREEVGHLTALGADTAIGLRVLRGIGGEPAFLARYRERSEAVRVAGVRVAVPQSTLDAAQVFLPGLFVVLVTWLGARFVVAGKLDPGQLVAFYGYAAFLVIPLRTSAEALDRITRAHVGARRILAILDVEPNVVDPDEPSPPPPVGASLVDARTAVTIEPGLMTCLVSEDPDETAELADRLGGFASNEEDVSFGSVPLGELPLAELRSRILVSEASPVVFAGTLRSALDPLARATDEQILAALDVASGRDIVEALDDGLDEAIDERGRSFSGGQRQRLVLARALIVAPEVMVLVEPTSAVDAHSEARIARALRAFRDGRTTVIVTASPLVLDVADRVLFLEAGRVRASGVHRDLLRESSAYRETVTRGESDE